MDDDLKKTINSIKDKISKIGEDEDVEDVSVLQNYFNLVTTNIRENNKKMIRNSFLLILSLVLFFLIKINSGAISEVKILFTTIKDNNLLLNTIPVFFAFIYFQNVALWNNNMNLWHIFDKLSKKIFKIGFKTDTSQIIRPFSLVQHL